MRRTSAVLKWVGFSLLAIITLAAAVALTFPDPDAVDPLAGWEIAVRAALFLTPTLTLTALAIWWPALAARILPIAVGLVVLMGIWFVVDPTGWEAWEDRNGAIRGIGAMLLLAPIAVLGLRRALAAGRLLLIVGAVAPVDVALTGGDWTSFTNGPYLALTIVALVAGLLYVLSDAAARWDGHRRPGARPAGGPGRPLRAP